MVLLVPSIFIIALSKSVMSGLDVSEISGLDFPRLILSQWRVQAFPSEVRITTCGVPSLSMASKSEGSCGIESPFPRRSVMLPLRSSFNAHPFGFTSSQTAMSASGSYCSSSSIQFTHSCSLSSSISVKGVWEIASDRLVTLRGPTMRSMPISSKMCSLSSSFAALVKSRRLRHILAF